MKGNRLWSFTYALTSLRRKPIRNTAIILLVSIGVMLPSTVFIWSYSSINMNVEDYLEEEVYQLAVTPSERDHFGKLQEIMDQSASYPNIRRVDLLTAGHGFVTKAHGQKDFNYTVVYYSPRFYSWQTKDFRCVPVTNDLLQTWEGAFEWEGNHILQPGQCIVGNQFVMQAAEWFGINVTVGTVLDFDVMTNYPEHGSDAYDVPERFDPVSYHNFEVVGIHSVKSGSSLLSSTQHSYTRPRSAVRKLSVLGISDSIFVLSQDLGEVVTEKLEVQSLFTPNILMQANPASLITEDITKAEESLLGIGEQIKEQQRWAMVKQVKTLQALTNQIQYYLQGQKFILLIMPILLISMFTTIFLSESSITTRKSEIATLRSRGAQYNQIMNSLMWESIIISIIGLMVGFGLGIFGSSILSVGSMEIIFDLSILLSFLKFVYIPITIIPIAGLIALYLPILYLIHIRKNIRVIEIGQTNDRSEFNKIKGISIRKWGAAFSGIIIGLLIHPFIFTPNQITAIVHIMSITGILFVASYLGSRLMQQITAKAKMIANISLGQKSLYVIQSLKRRGGSIIPLLVILTLALSTTTMLLTENATFHSTMEKEVNYAIGADMRVRFENQVPLNHSEILESMENVDVASPLLETHAVISESDYICYGINLTSINQVAYFQGDEFFDRPVHDVLNNLKTIENSVVIPKTMAMRLNKSIGNSIRIGIDTGSEIIEITYTIVALMSRFPGLGLATPSTIDGVSIANAIDYEAQVASYILTNSDYFSPLLCDQTNQHYFVSLENTNLADETNEMLCENLDVKIDSPYLSFDKDNRKDLNRFIMSFNGLTVLGCGVCIFMVLVSISLFFDVFIIERNSEYAIFRAIGAKNREVSGLIFGEFVSLFTAILIISLLLGLVFGISMKMSLFFTSPFIPILPVNPIIDPLLLSSVTVAQWLFMLLACIVPLRKISKSDIVQILRNL